MRVVVYIRCSTNSDRQDTKNQLLQLKDWARKEGHEIVKVYEEYKSGSKGAEDREALNSLLKDCASYHRGFDCVAFWSLDRLSREGTYKTIHYLEHFKKNNVKYHSLNEPYISSLGDFGEVVVSIMAFLAKQENLRRSENIKAGLRRTVQENGTKLGRKAGSKHTDSILRMKKEGLNNSEIARELDISRQTVLNILKRAA